MEARRWRTLPAWISLVAVCGCSGQIYRGAAMHPDLVLVGRVESVEKRSYFDRDYWDDVNVVAFRYSDQPEGRIHFVMPNRAGVSGCTEENAEQIYIAFLKTFRRSEPEIKEFKYYTWTCLPVDANVAQTLKSELTDRE